MPIKVTYRKSGRTETIHAEPKAPPERPRERPLEPELKRTRPRTWAPPKEAPPPPQEQEGAQNRSKDFKRLYNTHHTKGPLTREERIARAVELARKRGIDALYAEVETTRRKLDEMQEALRIAESGEP